METLLPGQAENHNSTSDYGWKWKWGMGMGAEQTCRQQFYGRVGGLKSQFGSL